MAEITVLSVGYGELSGEVIGKLCRDGFNIGEAADYIIIALVDNLCAVLEFNLNIAELGSDCIYIIIAELFDCFMSEVILGYYLIADVP